MTRPTDRELRALYQKHGGNFSKVAEELGRPITSVKHWFRGTGLKGTGRGGQPRLTPPERALRACYSRHGGNLQAMSEDLGFSRNSMHRWLAEIGLAGRGREKFEPIYPVQIPLSVKDGHVVIYSDAHFWPMVKSRAYDAMLVALRKLKPKVVIGNGDLLDGAKISKHEPIGWEDLPSVDDELYEAKQRQAEIARAAPDAEKIGLTPAPTTGAEVQAIVERLYQSSPKVIDTAAKILGK